jgi:chromate reductase, NAD(P)H dehydrogenase (quinone)
MPEMKKIFAICGNTLEVSSNLFILQFLQKQSEGKLAFEIFQDLADLPHFNPALDGENPPAAVFAFREKIAAASGVIICTPEYVFSLPGSLKNALEWTVSTTVFDQKPCGLITASAHGTKAHESLELIMRTIGARFEEQHRLLIQGVKGKFDHEGQLKDEVTKARLNEFWQAFIQLMDQVFPKSPHS